ncbi:MAG: glycoside hydrolase family 57 protein [Bacteroidales bacterium]|nr:glycoside hydrolase family 57 protein [Bacteroidales bacterium]MBQ6185057.1 glycoside hydrolase family 57 protein [Bacteroidales bacterium]
MKKSICLYFQVHQPTRLRLYRFFDIGKDSHYYDDFTNRTILHRVAQRCYLPMNRLLLDLIKKHGGAFKVTFSITGSALEQFDRYEPEVVDSFRELAATGNVEFLAETYYHSLSSLASEGEFKHQVEKHVKTIEDHFGVTPKAFRNTEMIYSDSIGRMVYSLGFKTMLTEGAKHILGWKSPDYVYTDPLENRLKLLLRNYSLSDDIAFRFSDRGWDNWPLTGEKFLSWLKAADGDIINLFMDYETFGEHQRESSGIFDFMRYLPDVVLGDGSFEFTTPSAATRKYKAIAEIDVPDPISWADEERDVTAWLGNELQQDAFNKLYEQSEKLALLNDPVLWEEFGHLQESDHLYYMSTKFFSDGEVHRYFNPYNTPYEAFINYMNALSDFILRIDDAVATSGQEPVRKPVKKKKTK